MGKYSNVDVGALTSKLNEIADLSEPLSSNLSSDLGKSSAITNITKALNKVTGSGCQGSLGNLKKAIDNLNSICAKISEYQEIEKDINDIIESPDSYEWKDYGYYAKNSDGSDKIGPDGKKVWVENLVKEMKKTAKDEIERKQKKMENLELQIDNM